SGQSNHERTLQVVNDGGQWRFEAYGSVLPFEQPERYKVRPIRKRFTPEMLEAYCSALGIRLFDERFYGPRCALFHSTQQLPPHIAPQTYESWQREWGLR